MNEKTAFQPVAYLTNLALRGLIGLCLMLPYRWRIPFAGWAVSNLVAPVAGWRQRVRDNLALILPDLSQAEVNRMARAVPNNVGRMVIELYSGAEFKAHVKNSTIRGEGLAAILEARERGQGVILVSGHFGNYDVPRAVLSAHGHAVAGLYMTFKNPYFTRHYVKTIKAIGAPVFERSRRGLAEMVKHLRQGGLVGMLIDQHMRHGAALTFFGKPAKTALSSAELALKYDCLLVPIYGVRQPDGISFDLVIEPPVPHSSPEAMTQALNDSLEAITRTHLDQWFWIHRRWK